MRATLLAAIAAGTLLLLCSSASAASNLSYGCDPPLPRTAANCGAWHNTPVKLVWSWNQIDFVQAPIPGSDCTSPRTFTADTTGTQVHCYVWGVVGNTPVDDLIATVRVDMTPPVVTGMTAARTPDHDGWWNHPVALAFAGTDATSGIASCDTVNYAGPDSDAANVTATCTDVAGNTATGAFPIKYDATAPTVAPGSSDNSKVGRISLNWTTSPDAVSSSVVRSPGVGGAPASEVYSGANRSFMDSAVTGGKTYTYSINASDPAGNVASTTMSVLAKAPPATKAPRLDWRRVKGADYYNVQLYRNGHKILSAWPRFSRLQVHKKWRFHGKQRKLSAGTYHWYVWPGFGDRRAHRYGKLITQKKFKIG